MNRTSHTGHADALDVLHEDHESLIEMMNRLPSGTTGTTDAADFLAALTIHAAIERDIFYPAARQVAPDNPFLSESDREVERLTALAGHLTPDSAEETDFRERLDALAQLVQDHVDNEETLLFPVLRKQPLGSAVGDSILERRQELQQEYETQGAYAGASRGIGLGEINKGENS